MSWRSKWRFGVYLLFALLANSWSSRAIANPTADANNRFGFALLQKLAAPGDPDENIFISPVSVSQALDLSLEGARGQTKAELAKALDVDGIAASEFGPQSLDLTNSLVHSDPNIQVRIANALWVESGSQLNPTYQETCAKYFGAQTSTVDFSDSLGASATINSWVSNKTDGKIPVLVSPETVKSAKIVITNAVYFHGLWQHQFQTSETTDGPFTTGSGTSVTLPMMFQRHDFDAVETPQFQALRLPYGNGSGLSMVIVLPTKGVSVSALIGDDGAGFLTNAIGSLTNQEVEIHLPRFQVGYTSDLVAPLQALGIADAFTNHADFTGMSASLLKISDVIHKTLVDVDETGTIAAAATGIVMAPTAIAVRPNPPLVIRVDHPFLCAIRDDQTGALLFLGIINRPEDPSD